MPIKNTLTSWNSVGAFGFTAGAGLHKLSTCAWGLCAERHLLLFSKNCFANSVLCLLSPRYTRTYSFTSYGDSISRKKPTNVGTNIQIIHIKTNRN